MIRYYTREAGVRNLERELSKISRKAVKQLLLNPTEKTVTVDSEEPRRLPRRAPLPLRQGRGERSRRSGHGPRLDRSRRRTADHRGGGGCRQGQAHAHGPARRSHAGVDSGGDDGRAQPLAVLGLDVDFYQKADVHIHVPEGATPKDGPSAGIGMCTALISALTKIPVRSDVAMTGRDHAARRGAADRRLKEKLLAAHRGGITTVLIPDDNVKDLAEIADNIKEKLDIRSVKWIDEVLQVA
jgi:ATP-dependent Lon protease